MSLIINADGEYLTGVGGDFGTNFPNATLAIWVKRDDYSRMEAYCGVSPDVTVSANSITLAHYGAYADCRSYPGSGEIRVDGAGNTASLAWQLLVFVYEKNVATNVYTAIAGGSVVSTTGPTGSVNFGELIDQVIIGAGGHGFTGAWNARARLSHCAFWNSALSSSDVSALFNGGTAGAGKNPQAVAGSSLKFYAPLTSDATVTVGGITLSATGTLTYDGADNPNVDSYGGGSVDGSAAGATLTGTASLTAGSASGTSAGTAPGATLTGTGSLTVGAASGNGTGSFTTAAMENNSGAGLLASTAVVWTWYEGAVGGAPTSTVHGTGTTNSSGILTATGLPIAAGFLLVRTTDSSGVYYQAGTPA